MMNIYTKNAERGLREYSEKDSGGIMVRLAKVFILCLSSIIASAEYDTYIFHLRITTSTQLARNHNHEGYLILGRENGNNLSLNEWKEELCLGCESTGSAVLYHHRVSYTPKPSSEPDMERGTYYQLHDSFLIDTSRILKVELLDVAWESALSGIGSSLQIEDTSWSNRPYLKHTMIEVPILMCDDCEDHLIKIYDIYIHEDSERINWALERLRGMEEMYLKRLSDIEYYYGYLNKDSPQFKSLLKYYGPALKEFLKLLENEKVVFVVDSGW